MRHALIIGGSGMLKDTSIWLANKYDTVTVIGRSQKKMGVLIKQCKNINPLYLEYHDTNNLKLAIEEQIRKLGDIDLIVAWVHFSDLPVNFKRIWAINNNIKIFNNIKRNFIISRHT